MLRIAGASDAKHPGYSARLRLFARNVHRIIKIMWHRHLNHGNWTLAAVDDVIARGRLDDWKQLRDEACRRADVRDRILSVCAAHLSDPYSQRYHFWDFYVRQRLA